MICRRCKRDAYSLLRGAVRSLSKRAPSGAYMTYYAVRANSSGYMLLLTLRGFRWSPTSAARIIKRAADSAKDGLCSLLYPTCWLMIRTQRIEVRCFHFLLRNVVTMRIIRRPQLPYQGRALARTAHYAKRHEPLGAEVTCLAAPAQVSQDRQMRSWPGLR